MSLSPGELESLTDMLQAIEPERPALNAWERGFIDDQVKRFDQYGADIRLSPKQWSAIRKIYEKVTGDVESPPPDEAEINRGER